MKNLDCGSTTPHFEPANPCWLAKFEDQNKFIFVVQAFLPGFPMRVAGSWSYSLAMSCLTRQMIVRDINSLLGTRLHEAASYSTSLYQICFDRSCRELMSPIAVRIVTNTVLSVSRLRVCGLCGTLRCIDSNDSEARCVVSVL